MCFDADRASDIRDWVVDAVFQAAPDVEPTIIEGKADDAGVFVFPKPRNGRNAKIAGLAVGTGALVAGALTLGAAAPAVVGAAVLAGAGMVGGSRLIKRARRSSSTGGLRSTLAGILDERGNGSPIPLPLPASHPLHRLLQYSHPYRNQFRRAFGLTIVNKSLDLAPPFLIALAVDIVSGGTVLAFLGVAGIVPQIVLLGGLSVVIWAAESITEYLSKVEWLRFSHKLQRDLRLDAYNHIQYTEMAYLEDTSTGKLVSNLNNDINQIERFFEDGIAVFIGVGTTGAIMATAFILVAPTLAWITLAPIPVILWFASRYERDIDPLMTEKRESIARINSVLVNNLSGITTIRSFTAEEEALEQIRRESEDFIEVSEPVNVLSSVFTPKLRMAVLFGFVGTMVAGATLVSGGTLTPGAFAFMMLLTQRVLWPLTYLGHSITNYQHSMTSSKRVLRLLEAPTGPLGGDIRLPRTEVEGEVRFEGVEFAYDDRHPVLERFSLTCEAQETTALVGVTGSGKTTVVKLLLRLYEYGGGDIFVDGTSIRDLDTRDLRDAIGLVSQDVFLFDGTVRGNIAYGRRDANLGEIVNAAKLAEVHDFIDSLPNKYDTVVGERGIKLSGGQRQRLCIARAILKDPPLLILDEATSSVDNETEAAIQRSIERVSRGRTTIAIAHRLSTVRNADRIFVLGNGGAVIEHGTHEQLVMKNGTYASLWRVQTGLVGAKEGTTGEVIDISGPGAADH